MIGGRYGLASKEFTPGMVKAVFDHLAGEQPKRHFTIGITDDVTHLSIPADTSFRIPRPAGEVEAMFFGLGSDGTVGANKSSVKIIGENTDLYAQGHFVYDSKKSGSVTVSHLRFGPEPILATYEIERADFVACHQFGLLEKMKVLERARDGATFLLNSPYPASEVWDHLPATVQSQLIEKHIEFWVIDANRIAEEVGMGSRINTVMQPCFFHLSGVLPADEAVARIKESVQKAYGKRGPAIVERNFAAIDRSLQDLDRVTIPEEVTSRITMRDLIPADAPDFVRNVTARMLADEGELAAGQRVPGGRHLPNRHDQVREAGDRPGDPGLGRRDLHRLRQVRHRVPSRHHPHEGVRARGARRRPRGIQVQGVPLQGAPRPSAHDPGRARRLHGVRRLRRGLPREEQDRGASQGHRHGVRDGAP